MSVCLLESAGCECCVFDDVMRQRGEPVIVGRCVVRARFISHSGRCREQLARAQGLDLTGCDDAWGHRYRGADRCDKGEDGKNGKEAGEPQAASSRS